MKQKKLCSNCLNYHQILNAQYGFCEMLLRILELSNEGIEKDRNALKLHGEFMCNLYAKNKGKINENEE